MLDAVAVNGVGMAAADLHELEVVTASQFGDGFHQCACGRRVAEFVNELHWPTPSGYFRGVERFYLVYVVGAHFLHLIQCHRRLALVDLGHRETDVHEHQSPTLRLSSASSRTLMVRRTPLTSTLARCCSASTISTT